MATPEHLEQAVREAGPWVERGARAGAISRGVVYLALGGFALQAAFDSRGQPAGPGGVFDAIARQTLGRPLLAVLAIGLAGYAIWDLVRAAFEPYQRFSGATRVLQRLGWAVGGAVSGLLAVTAFRPALGVGHVPVDDEQARGWTATILAAPFGSWIIGVTGAVIISVGAVFVWQGWRADLHADLDATPVNPTIRRWTLNFGRFGRVARGIVLILIGLFLIVADIHANPSEARGIAGALGVLARQPYGRWLLSIVATGFLSHGLYELLRARYSRFRLFQ